jgi:lipoprotein NlpI
VAFSLRGRAFAVKQHFDRTIADCREAIRLDPKSPYAVLWLYLARTRTGAKTATAELEANAKNLKQPDWPYPVIELFLGRRAPKTVLSAATNLDERCQANLYVGKWRLLRGERSAAKMALKTAADQCPKNLIEYSVVRAERRRLRP